MSRRLVSANPYTIGSTLQQFTSGTTTWTVPAGVQAVEVLVVAGGGAGGGSTYTGTTDYFSGGGGGAGRDCLERQSAAVVWLCGAEEAVYVE
mgnify:CR=1 FL=1